MKEANATSVEVGFVIEKGVAIEKLQKASGLIILPLVNAPMRVVAEVDSNPSGMLALLDAIIPRTELYHELRYKLNCVVCDTRIKICVDTATCQVVKQRIRQVSPDQK